MVNEFENLVIGFGGEYYTLWYKQDNNHLTYLKNVSKDRKTAEELYPGVEIDEGLKGYFYEKREYIPDPIYTTPNVFKFGMYKGTTIYSEGSEFKDSYVDYVAYVITFFSMEEDILAVEKLLERSGRYKTFIHKDIDGKIVSISCVTIERYKKMLVAEEKLNEFLKVVESGDSFVIPMEKNPDGEGCLYGLLDSLTVKFKDYKVCYYNGFEYSLPTINGKGKRVKGKEIKVTKYEYDSCNKEIVIDTWELVK